MKKIVTRVVAGLMVLGLAACTSHQSGDGGAGEPSEAAARVMSLEPGQFYIVSTGPYLGMSLENGSALYTQWSFDDDTALEIGDIVDIELPAEACAESYPAQCQAKSADVVHGADEVLAVSANLDSSPFHTTPQSLALTGGFPSIVTDQQLTPEYDGELDNMTVVEVRGDDAEVDSLPDGGVLVYMNDAPDDLVSALADGGHRPIVVLQP